MRLEAGGRGLMEEFLLRWGALLLAACGLLYTVISARSKAATDRVAKLETTVASKAEAETVRLLAGKLDIAEDHISRLVGEMRHLPSREQTHELALALKDMKGEIGVLAEKLKPISHTTERLQEFLIDEAKAKRGAA